MKAIRVLLFLIIILIFVSCGRNGTGPDERFCIFLTPEQNSIQVGNTFVLTVSIRSVKNLFAASFDILFDTSIVRVDSITIPPSSILGTNGSVSFYNSNSNGISVGVGRTQTSGSDNVSGDGSLVEISFTGLSVGSTVVDFQDVDIVDETGTSNADIGKLETKSSHIIVQ